MHSKRMRRAFTALIFLLALAGASLAQPQPPATAASGQAQLSQIPWRRDSSAGEPIVQSAGWAVLFVGVVAGVGFVLIRRRGRRETGAGWMPFSIGANVPKAPWRMALTQQATLHLVEWQGDELLLGCTPQSVTLLARRAASSSPEADCGDRGKP